MGIHYGKADFINYGKPSLLLDFARNKSLVDRISGNNLITFTRASTGTYVGADGLIKTAAANEPRFDHNPVTGESLGLLIEESRSNIHNTQGSLTGITNPQGSTDQQYFMNWSNASYTVRRQRPQFSYTLSAGTYVLSFYVKPVGQLSNITYTVGSQMGVVSNVNSIGLQFIALSGTISSQYGGELGYPTVIQQLNNNWYRVSLTTTFTGSGTGFFYWYPSGSATTTLDTDTGFYVWGAQLEQGSFPTSYIPTSGSTVTRSADIAQITGTNFSSFYNPSAGTYIADLKLTNTSVSGLPSPFRTNSLFLFFGPSGFFTKNTTSNVQHSQGPITTNRTKWAFYHNASNGYGMTIDGRSPINAAQTIGSSDTNISFGDIQGETAYHLYKMVYYPTRLPNESLQYLTQ